MNTTTYGLRYVNGSWFVYTNERVLGPFKTRNEAVKDVRGLYREVDEIKRPMKRRGDT